MKSANAVINFSVRIVRLIDRFKGDNKREKRVMNFGREWDIYCVPGACVGGGGGGFGLFPNVVNAVELTPKSTMKTEKSIVRLPHCVNRFNGCILNVIFFDMCVRVKAVGNLFFFLINLVRCFYSLPKNAWFPIYFSSLSINPINYEFSLQQIWLIRRFICIHLKDTQIQ